MVVLEEEVSVGVRKGSRTGLLGKVYASMVFLACDVEEGGKLEKELLAC